MPVPAPSPGKDAHYHAIKATARWAELVAALQAKATGTADERKRKDDQRKRDTTYAHHELGGH